MFGQVVALRAHCVCTAWAMRAYCARGGRDTHPRILVTSLVAQRSSNENDETAFNLVLHYPYKQTTQTCKVRLHLLMASEVSDVVGMKAVPQTPQGLRAMYGYITPAFSGSP